MSRRVRNQPDRRPPLACRQLLLPLRRRQILLLLLLFLLMPFPGQVRGEEKRSEQVRITGINRMWGDTEGERTYLEGDLVITKGDTIIHSSFAEVKKPVRATGTGRHGSRAVRLVKDELKQPGRWNSPLRTGQSSWRCPAGRGSKDAAGEVEKEDHPLL